MTEARAAPAADESARIDWHLVDRGTGWARKALGALRLARPAQLIWLDVCLSLTIFVGITGHLPAAHYLWFVLAAVLADAGACTLNDIGDLRTDAASTESNRSGRPLVVGSISKRAAWVQGLALFATGLAIAAWLSPWVLACAVALVVISYQYSFPPLRMNARPYVPQVFWFTFGILYFLAVYAYVVRYDGLMPGYLTSAVAMIVGVQLFAALGETLAKDLRDLDNDRRGGRMTTSVFLGPVRSARYALYMSFAGLTVWLFAALGETLAKDLRDLDNDRRAGKVTTSVFLGPVRSARYALYMSFAGLTVWLFAVIVLYGNWGYVAIAMLAIAAVWSAACKRLVDDLCARYTKASARKLHLGFISTFAVLLVLSMLSFV